MSITERILLLLSALALGSLLGLLLSAASYDPCCGYREEGLAATLLWPALLTGPLWLVAILPLRNGSLPLSLLRWLAVLWLLLGGLLLTGMLLQSGGIMLAHDEQTALWTAGILATAAALLLGSAVVVTGAQLRSRHCASPPPQPRSQRRW